MTPRLPVASILALALSSACGASVPGGYGGNGGGPNYVPVTITLTQDGVDVPDVSVPVGGRVLFVNRDFVAHEIASDAASACDELDSALIQPGASFRATMAAHVEPCRYHDFLDAENKAFQGTITVYDGSATPEPVRQSAP